MNKCCWWRPCVINITLTTPLCYEMLLMTPLRYKHNADNAPVLWKCCWWRPCTSLLCVGSRYCTYTHTIIESQKSSGTPLIVIQARELTGSNIPLHAVPKPPAVGWVQYGQGGENETRANNLFRCIAIASMYGTLKKGTVAWDFRGLFFSQKSIVPRPQINIPKYFRKYFCIRREIFTKIFTTSG